MNEVIRWGVIGTGAIAHKFAQGLAVLDDARLVAVASRARDSANRFGEAFGVPHRHLGVSALAADEEVDVVYIATPHPMHQENTLDCLNRGKAVLCEKPFAMNVSEAETMVNTAREKGVFLMEAMWTHFFPAMAEVRKIVRSRGIGEIRQVHANFSFRCAWDPDSRLLNTQLGGGALLDVGIYPVALSTMIYQREPSQIQSIMHIGETGVDEQTSIVLGYENGAMAVLACAIRTDTIHEAAIYGTEGYIKIPPMFWQPNRIVVKSGTEPEKEIHFDCTGNGYNYEAEEVARCLRNRNIESHVMSLETTLIHMKILDTVRRQCGLIYPMEP